MLRNLFCVLTAIVWTICCFPVVTFWALLGNRARSLAVVRRPWSTTLLWAGGARLEVRGAEHVTPGRPYIFVSNHQSTIDIPALFVGLPADVQFVAKSALAYVPFLGWYMRVAGFVFVDRGNTKRAIESLDKAAAQIRAGASIVMFPEGTRSDHQQVMSFKKGPFALAQKAGVPIIPVTIEGSGKLMPKNSWNITPGPIVVSIGAPIDPAPFVDDREGLLRAVRGAIIAESLRLGGKGGEEPPPRASAAATSERAS